MIDRERVCRDHGIPLEFAGRLVGETQAELEADARALAALRDRPAAQPKHADFVESSNTY